jgi:hypothetical protein
VKNNPWSDSKPITERMNRLLSLCEEEPLVGLKLEKPPAVLSLYEKGLLGKPQKVT